MTITTVDIRPIAETELILLEQRFPQGGVSKHAERYARQRHGDVTYLVAWDCGHPVGHALLNWGGSRDEPVASQLLSPCPDIEDLFVLAELRSQGIGSQLIGSAEQLALNRGYVHLGMSVAAKTNDAARQLYERLGYRDSHFGEYVERGEFIDPQGKHRTWQETCIYLVKDLRKADAA